MDINTITVQGVDTMPGTRPYTRAPMTGEHYSLITINTVSMNKDVNISGVLVS